MNIQVSKPNAMMNYASVEQKEIKKATTLFDKKPAKDEFVSSKKAEKNKKPGLLAKVKHFFTLPKKAEPDAVKK